MVLHNSKWDKKAKHKYMKKHGIVPTSDQRTRNQPTATEYETEESDDSIDEDELIDQYYPKLAKDVTPEQKAKIKQQTLDDIAKNIDDGTSGSESYEDQSENNQTKELNQDIEGENKETDGIKPRRKKKLHSNSWRYKGLPTDPTPETDDINIKDFIKTTDDYNSVFEAKKKDRHINKVDINELLDMNISEGSKPSQSANNSKNNIRNMTIEEIEENRTLNEKIKKHNLYEDIKRKFDSEKLNKSSKVIELYNTTDFTLEKSNIEAALKKIAYDSNRDTVDLDSDLAILLGQKLESTEDEVDDITGFSGLALEEKGNITPNKEKGKVGKTKADLQSESFLDDLLG